MSMFSKAVTDIVWDDLCVLLDDSVTENVRLEFKRSVPSKNETLKKLSALGEANSKRP